MTARLYDLIAAGTRAWAVNLDAEHDGASLRCLACGPSPYIFPMRLTAEDLDAIASELGPHLCVCGKCEKEIV